MLVAIDKLIKKYDYQIEGLEALQRALAGMQLVSTAEIYRAGAGIIRDLVTLDIPDFGGIWAEGWLVTADMLDNLAEDAPQQGTPVYPMQGRGALRLEFKLQALVKTAHGVFKTQLRDLERTGPGAGEFMIAERIKLLHFVLNQVLMLFRSQLKRARYYEAVGSTVAALRELFLQLGEPSRDHTGHTTGSGFSWAGSR